MGLLKEFREFAVKGNVIDLAVGVIIGASFGKIVSSLVDDVVMPPLGMLTGRVNFADLKWELKPAVAASTDAAGNAIAAQKAVNLNFGNFINNVIQFAILAFVIFLMVKAINQAKKRFDTPPAASEPVVKQCPYCLSDVPIKATKCKFCTAEIPA